MAAGSGVFTQEESRGFRVVSRAHSQEYREPRTSPYSFQGLGEEGLAILAQARQETGLPVVTEVLDVRQLDLVAPYADMIQAGSRNTDFCTFG